MAQREPRLMFVGDVLGWESSGRSFPDVANAAFVDPTDITAELLEAEYPDIVLCPLFSAKFDAVELALTLSKLNFKGCLRAVTRPVPSPKIILAEVATIAPDLDFDLFFLEPDLLKLN